MSAIINNYRQLDVAFLLLNDLTTKLRTAGARISVRKVGNFHRITVLKEPTVATIEQILGDTSGETETPHLSNNNAITSPSEITSSTDDTPSEDGANTVPTLNKDIQDNSVLEANCLQQRFAIAQTSPESITPPDDTPSEDTANTVPTLNEDIEDKSVLEAIALPTSPESITPPDDTHSGDSKDIIPDKTSEIITDSTDSSTPDNSSSEITNIPDSPELASSEDLQGLTLKRLKELAKLHKIPGFSRMKKEKLVTKLHNLATKKQIL